MNPKLLDLLGLLAVGAVFFAGLGVATAVLRVVLPRLARAADASLAGLGTARMAVTGILPLVGAMLLTAAAAPAGAGGVVAIVVWLPIGLLTVAGSMAAVPHLGGRLLKSGADASLFARSAVGGIAVGLAMATWAVQALGLLVSLLLLGWFLGAGIGLLFPRRVAADAPAS
jgi:hypothetical protein